MPRASFVKDKSKFLKGRESVTEIKADRQINVR